MVRLTGYVAATPDFAEHPQVVNAASELLRDAFGADAGMGTRLALGVSSLPLQSPVELELVFEVLDESPAGYPRIRGEAGYPRVKRAGYPRIKGEAGYPRVKRAGYPRITGIPA